MALSIRPAMAPMAFVYLLFCLNIIVISGAKLNAPKVLLPYYSSVITNFTLQVEDSPEEAQTANCYRWRSTRPEIAQVQLVNSTDGSCAQTAIVSAISKTPHQMATVILAENKVTGEILRTNVIVGEIVRLEIETTTRLLYLEDSPEELIARGYDSEGNIFSNLEGMSFEWNLISDNETGHDAVDAHNILRIKRFSESHYTTPRHIVPLEEQGQQGDMILVEGIRTGSAKVSAKLKDPAYKNVKPHDVRIMVIANIMLSPPEAYVLTHGYVKYKVEILRHNSLKEIKMPSKQYYLEIKDQDICKLDAQNSMATGLVMGSTEVVLKDRNIVLTEFFRQPSAMIHVVAPGFLAFVVLPHRKWSLETGREYEIYVEIYDTDSHKIQPSDNVRVLTEFQSKYFQVLFSSTNGTYHIVKALLKGETLIEGTLVGILDSNGKEQAVRPEVKRSQDVEIHDPITVTPQLVLFPWDPVSRCVHRFSAKAQGGSGEYVWSTSDVSVTSVNIKGQISTVGPGKCNVTAADARNSAYYGSSTVHVLPPAEINFPLSRVEAAVGTTLILPINVFALIDKNLHSFTDCHQLPLTISYSDSSIFEHVARDEKLPFELPEDGCTSLTFLAKKQGYTEVTVTYQIKSLILQASVTIAAYHPLKAIDPEIETIVALGSSKEVLFTGGPQPWVLDSSKFFQNLKAEKDDLVKTEKLSPGSIIRGVHAFVILCRDISEQEIQLSVGNEKTAKNPYPVTETTAIRFVCAKPVELHLQPILKINPRLPPCPVQHENHLPMPVHCGKDLDILVSVTDSIGRRFDNISSLAIEWTVLPTSLAELLYTKELKTHVDSQPDGKKSLLSYQTIRPLKKSGSIFITASIERYKISTAKAVGKTPEKLNPVISKSLELLLVDEAVLSPSSVSVFNHPSNKVNIDIHHGSGFFHLESLHSPVLAAKYDSKGKAIQVNPLKDGSQSLTVYDLCLDVATHPSVTVSVSGVGSVHIMVIEKVEVLKEVLAKVQVLDLKGRPLLSSFFPLMGLKLEAASNIVTLRPLHMDVGDGVTGVYTVYGASVGHTTLTANVKLPTGQVIHSTPKPLEVFPPLRLEPKNITLIIGAVLQVLAYGGPQPQSNVEFSILDSKISTVTSGGILDAQDIGTTRVIGKAVGTDSVTGEKVVYSQDDAIVNVIILKGIRIHAPLTRLQTGTQMPVYAMGVTENETPFSFGNSVPPLIFIWTASSRDVIQLQSIYHKNGIYPVAENNFAQHALARETGHSSIKLRVETSRESRLQLYDDGPLFDEVQVQVFEKLTLLNPSVCHGIIRITPNTDTFLKTNRDVAARVQYYITQDNNSPVVRIMDNGQLRSGPLPGSVVLHVVAEEEFGINQTLVILIKVKPVSYLMINLDSNIVTALPNQLTAVPLGSTLQFSVSYHDDVGDEFYATNVQLGIRCNRYDLLQVSNGVDNNTLIVRASEIGNAVLKVWDKHKPSTADYVNIPVGHAVSPAQVSVTLGSIICFTSPLITESGLEGTWQSKSLSLSMEDNLGISVAKAVGRALVTYTVAPTISTKTEVNIEPIKSIKVDKGLGFLSNSEVIKLDKGLSFLSNSEVRGKSSFFSVTFNNGGNIVGSNCTSVVLKSKFNPSYLPYSCHLDLTNKSQDINIADIFTIIPHFDYEKGLHGCLVTTVPSHHRAVQIAQFESDITLVVRVPETQGQPDVLSSVLSLSFIPAFHVHNHELHLSTTSPQAFLKITASPKTLPDLEISVNDATLLQAKSKEPISNNVVQFPVMLIESVILWNKEEFDLWVEITNKHIGHTVRIPIYVKLIGQKPEMAGFYHYHHELSWSNLLKSTFSNYQSWFIICVIVLLIAGAVLVGYNALVSHRYKTSDKSNVFMTKGGMSPTPSSSFIQQSTPLGSASYTGRSSPTSPKLWSVSYNQQDSRTSPYKRNPYPFSLSPKS
ncbi:nuclear pore membrane glycoprotein 210-like [Physella acuta]|uniref:nuclear pore membrane glycoprotein 210-like n=1 Tax=Physella acuta TaxID=109671 RepID=UPI0027DDC064|nr:nuclear pore membrane glycoprotein 210-like [Physella acuta]